MASKLVTMQWPEQMIEAATRRAKELGLSRSMYLQQLVRRDLGMATPTPSGSNPSSPAKGPISLDPVSARRMLEREARGEKCDHPMWQRSHGICMGCGEKVK